MNNDSVCMKPVKGSKIEIDYHDNFYKQLRNTKFLVIDNIRVRKGDKLRRLATMVKHPDKNLITPDP